MTAFLFSPLQIGENKVSFATAKRTKKARKLR